MLESGSRGLLLSNFMAGRNYFDGRVVAQNGAQRAVVPFYSAARVEDRGETFWLLAPVDGRTQFFDGGLKFCVRLLLLYGASDSCQLVWGWEDAIAKTEDCSTI